LFYLFYLTKLSHKFELHFRIKHQLHSLFTYLYFLENLHLKLLISHCVRAEHRPTALQCVLTLHTGNYAHDATVNDRMSAKESFIHIRVK